MLAISLAWSMIPSVKAKPTPKSSRSAGVAIITALVDPPKVSAIALSSATYLDESVGFPPRQKSFARC
ncbi:hypothetical protein [Bradyrhizobium sp. 159]|uniref:hypothetical protein n=1 Tax=Bradyrhizobium sp. 159 TaxID=2782632 RepID=UPI0031FF1D1E